MATERLYYDDCYRTSFEAQILRISDDGCNVILDRTLVYPPSGGQPADNGVLAEIRIANIVDGEEITHVLERPLPPGITSVQGEIDWPRRYEHMQQHTGQHLLSAVFEQVLGFRTLSFHMGEEVSTIELQTGTLTDADITRVEARVNQLTRAAVPVRIRYEEAEAASGLRKASGRKGTLRIIEIDGVDKSACGGTHVRSTAEVPPIQVRGSEKVRGNIRIEFVCGARAIARAKDDFRLLAAVARDLGTPLASVAESVTRLRERLAAAEKEGTRLTMEAARYEADALYRETPSSAGGFRFALSRVAALDDRARQKAIAFTAHWQAGLIAWSEKASSVLLAVSSDCGLHAGNLLKEFLAKRGGKGGGSATLAQGSVTISAELAQELQLACQNAADQAAGKKE